MNRDIVETILGAIASGDEDAISGSMSDLAEQKTDLVLYRGKGGKTLAHALAGAGFSYTLRRVLEAAPELRKETDSRGNTYLHAAAINGRILRCSIEDDDLLVRNDAGLVPMVAGVFAGQPKNVWREYAHSSFEESGELLEEMIHYVWNWSCSHPEYRDHLYDFVGQWYWLPQYSKDGVYLAVAKLHDLELAKRMAAGCTDKLEEPRTVRAIEMVKSM